MEVYGTFLNGENIYDSPLAAGGLVIMGNEADGISPAVAAECSQRLTIPAFGGGAESLNVSVACGIVLSEFKRR